MKVRSSSIPEGRLAAKFPETGIGLVGVSLAFGLTVLTMAYAVGCRESAESRPFAVPRSNREVRPGLRLRVASLTPRERQIMELVLAGNPSKNIAADLGINRRTVENHRAAIMKKTGSKSPPPLARLALAAAWNGRLDSLTRGHPNGGNAAQTRRSARPG